MAHRVSESRLHPRAPSPVLTTASLVAGSADFGLFHLSKLAGRDECIYNFGAGTIPFSLPNLRFSLILPKARPGTTVA